MVTGSGDTTARIWDLKTGELRHILEGHEAWINAVAISPDSRYVVTGPWDNTARIWDLKTGEHRHTLAGHTDLIDAVAISPDSRYVVTGSGDNTARIWDLKAFELLMRDLTLEQAQLIVMLMMNKVTVETMDEHHEHEHLRKIYNSIPDVLKPFLIPIHEEPEEVG